MNMTGGIDMTGKLIDAEKLKKHYAWWDDDERRTLFDQIVDAQPTIDAEPVRHAKLLNAHPYGECSNCGYLIDIREEFNYCPNCGADMRGEV